MKMTEQELAEIVVHDLQSSGWDIYQEVEHHRGIADIVAVRGQIQWVIEAKTTFGFKVIEQAFRWKGWCNYVSVAVPKMTSHVGERFCRDYGIGVISVIGQPYESLKAALQRRVVKIPLNDAQKDFCKAGDASGGRWTPFKQTCIHLVEKVKRNPGIEFNVLIKELDHHYQSHSSAKSCLRGFIGTVIPELRVEIIGRKLCVFITEGDKNGRT